MIRRILQSVIESKLFKGKAFTVNLYQGITQSESIYIFSPNAKSPASPSPGIM